jgi:hypothetical protein
MQGRSRERRLRLRGPTTTRFSLGWKRKGCEWRAVESLTAFGGAYGALRGTFQNVRSLLERVARWPSTKTPISKSGSESKKPLTARGDSPEKRRIQAKGARKALIEASTTTLRNRRRRTESSGNVCSNWGYLARSRKTDGVNQRGAGVRMETIWLLRRDSGLGPLGLQRWPIGGEFSIFCIRFPLPRRLIHGLIAGRVSAFRGISQGGNRLCRGQAVSPVVRRRARGSCPESGPPGY